jgi:ankyrin repeat protein
MLILAADDPVAVAATEAVQQGDLDALRRMLAERPELATAYIREHPDGMSRTLLHAATDWPGHFPNNAATVATLIDAGADVNARFTGPHLETPLHWAASSDDVEVLDVLLDAGADIEASGAVIAGGTPLTDAVAFAQWKTARRLVERGAHTPLREAAGLGLLDRVEAYCATDPQPSPDELTQAFWYAAHGGQPAVAELLLGRGADRNWIANWDGTTPLDAAVRNEAGVMVEWLRARGGRTADDLGRSSMGRS